MSYPARAEGLINRITYLCVTKRLDPNKYYMCGSYQISNERVLYIPPRASPSDAVSCHIQDTVWMGAGRSCPFCRDAVGVLSRLSRLGWKGICAMMIMKKEKTETTEWIGLLNQENTRMLEEKENKNYMGILEANTSKQRWKENQEYPRGTRILLKTRLCSRSLIRAINTKTLSLVRYPGPFLN